MKSPRSSSALRTSALLTPVLLGLISCKPADSTQEAPKSSSAATPPAAPAAQATPAAAQSAPAPATPGNSPEAPATVSPNPQKTAKQDGAASNAIPDNVLDSLLKQPKVETAPLPPTVAIVEGEEIKAEELETALKTVLAGQGMQADQLPADQKTQGYKMLLNELITQKLVASRSKGFAVKDEEVNARIDQIKARFPNPEAFEAQVTKAGQTVDKLREEIRTSIRQQGWIEEQLKDAPKASDADAEDFYQKKPPAVSAT